MSRAASLTLGLVLGAATALVGARPAGASEEEIHEWKKVALVASTARFGDVEVRATATTGATPRLQAVTIRAKRRSIVIPGAALKALPDVRLGTIAVHSEAGYDPEPWLYVVLETVASGASPDVKGQWVYLAVQGGKLHHASLKTQEASGQFKFEDLKFK